MLYTLGGLILALLLALGWGKYEHGEAVSAKADLSAYKTMQEASIAAQAVKDKAASQKSEADAKGKIDAINKTIPGLIARARAAGFNDGRLWHDTAAAVSDVAGPAAVIVDARSTDTPTAGCSDYRADLVICANSYGICEAKKAGLIQFYRAVQANQPGATQ